MKNVVDVSISFDCTGSMYPCLTQVRRNVTQLVRNLFSKVPGLRVSITAHGDYCDEGHTYVIKTLDFTDNEADICKFVNSVGQTGGGDAPECYELVLRKIRSLSWRAGGSKIHVLIGDDVPHGPNYPLNTQKIDWRNELDLLLEANINVYGVHAMASCRSHSRSFYEEIARKTGGFYLTLDQFANVNDMITAIALKQVGNADLEQFATQLSSAGRMNRDVASTFGTLLGKKVNVSSKTSLRDAGGKELVPVLPSRFQVLDVDTTVVIKDFVEAQGVYFQPGRGFYEVTKSEKVQGHKEIILMSRSTGDLFTGSKVREILGLTDVDGRLSSKSTLADYVIFVQSTSYNRKLTPGTKFLYEVDDWSK